MSESDKRVVAWPGGRPPGGAWPPCPPGPGPWPNPPDFFSALYWLERAFDDVNATKAFLKRIIGEIAADDPKWLADAFPTVGVTDGSSAQPGMVGEIVDFSGTAAYTTTKSTTITPMGVLPPGDWDIWAWCGFSTGMTWATLDNSSSPDPAVETMPPGVWWMGAAMGVPAGEELILATTHGWARTVQPTLMLLRLTATGQAAGTSRLAFVARRVR